MIADSSVAAREALAFEYRSKFMNRKKLWNDRNYAEQWEWAATNVLRFRTRTTDAWTYRIGDFTKDHCCYADRRDRAMTQDEITAFCEARINHAI